MGGIKNLVNVNSNSKLKMSLDGDFFKTWVEFLQPVHELTKGERAVFAAFLKKRYELSKVISDPEILDRELVSRPIKDEIAKECGIRYDHLKEKMTILRKKGVLMKDSNKFCLNLIPSISDDTEDGVGLMIYFDFKDEQQRIKLGPQTDSKKT